MFNVMRRARRVFCAALLTMTIAGNAAANFTCNGKVTYLGLSTDGVLHVSVGSFGVWYVCSLTSTYVGNERTYTPEACRGWYATILAAQKADSSVEFYFGSSGQGTNDGQCVALGSWQVPTTSPYHMRSL